MATYSPKRAAAEFRHSSSGGARSTPSPMKRDDATSPLAPENIADSRDRRVRVRSFFSFFNLQSLDESRVYAHVCNSKIAVFAIGVLILVGLVSVSSVFNRFVSLWWLVSWNVICVLTIACSRIYRYSLHVGFNCVCLLNCLKGCDLAEIVMFSCV